MTDTASLRAFVSDLLSDVGAEVHEEGELTWVHLPEVLQQSLEVPADLCLTLDARHVGEFGAELVASGSYILERLISLAIRRGRWDVLRLEGAAPDWLMDAMEHAAVEGGPMPDSPAMEAGEVRIFLLSFRATLTSDEKREFFHVVAVREGSRDGRVMGLPDSDAGFVPIELPDASRGLETAYHVATDALRGAMREEMDRFRHACLASLELEVRQILRYFDGTVREIRDAAPSGAEDVIRSVEAERDRRLAEALERFEPHATASLCGVRVLVVPKRRIRSPSNSIAVAREPRGKARTHRH